MNLPTVESNGLVSLKLEPVIGDRGLTLPKERAGADGVVGDEIDVVVDRDDVFTRLRR